MVIIWCKDWSMRYKLLHWHWQGTADEDREFPLCLRKYKSWTLAFGNKTYFIPGKIFYYKYRELYFNLEFYIFLSFFLSTLWSFKSSI